MVIFGTTISITWSQIRKFLVLSFHNTAIVAVCRVTQLVCYFKVTKLTMQNTHIKINLV